MSLRPAAEAVVADASDIAAAYAFCADLSRELSAEFPAALPLLPRRLRPHVNALYAFVRLAQAFAHEPEFEGEREERLKDWHRRLNEGDSRHPVFLALGRTREELHLPQELFDEMAGAALQDARQKRYSTFDELADYCRRSAAPIGRLVLMMHGYRQEEVLRSSDALCTGLKLARLWRDLSVDLKQDRIYIPEEDFKNYAYGEADLRMGVCNEKFVELMKFQVNRSRAFFEQARPLLKRLRWPLRWAVCVTWYGGRETLRRIRKHGFDALTHRPVLRDWDWLPLIVRTVLKA